MVTTIKLITDANLTFDQVADGARPCARCGGTGERISGRTSVASRCFGCDGTGVYETPRARFARQTRELAVTGWDGVRDW